MNAEVHALRMVVGAVHQVPAPFHEVGEDPQGRGQHFDQVDLLEAGSEVVRGEGGQEDLRDAEVEDPSVEDLGSGVGDLCFCSWMGQGTVDFD